MKKSEIKRRKRVVPAYQDQHLVPQTSSPYMLQDSGPSSVSPDPQQTGYILPTVENMTHPTNEPHPSHPSHHYITHENAATGTTTVTDMLERSVRAPIAVDFTNFSSRPSITSTATQHVPQSRKRSFSQSTAGDQAEQQNTRRAATSAENIDPSLSGAVSRNAHSPTTSSTLSAPVTAAARRKELEVEAARIREMLAAKEQEIAALGL